MTLDLYAGPLFRYYLGDWENIAEQYAREHGLEYVALTPEGERHDEAEGVDEETLRSAIKDWREVMTEGLGENLSQPLEWNEELAAPHFTDRPHWEGYSGLLLLAAHEEHPEFDPPEVIGEEWRKDPALLRSRSGSFSETEYLQILSPELWLPSPFDFSYAFIDLSGREICIGSASRLLDQLRTLNERTFKGQEWDLKEWREEEPKADGDFGAAARYGLSVFLEMAEHAMASRVPLKLDY